MMYSTVRLKNIVVRICGTNGSETQKASPINANGKRVSRFTQDIGKKPKTGTTLIKWQESVKVYPRHRKET
jgi:hypothetical protein